MSHFSITPKAFSLTGGTSFNHERAREKARDLEKTFVSTLMQSWLKHACPNGLFGGGAHERAFRPLLTEKLSETIDIGLADSIYRELLKKQGVSDDKTS